MIKTNVLIEYMKQMSKLINITIVKKHYFII